MAEQKILNRIYVIRGQKVMLDRDLAEMYGVETKVVGVPMEKAPTHERPATYL